MNGLIKIGVTTVAATLTLGVHADLKPMADNDLGGVVGRAGLTIDLETKRHIGEFAYRDGGYIILEEIGFGGSNSAEELAFSGGHGYLDNLRLEVDIAGSGAADATSGNPDNELHYGFSDYVALTQYHVGRGSTDSDMELAAGITTGTAVDAQTGLEIDTKRTFDDGTLLIHINPTDAWQKGGGYAAYDSNTGDDGSAGVTDFENLSYGAFLDIIANALDYGMTWDAVGVASSDYVVGSKGLETSTNNVTGKQNGTNHTTGVDATTDTTVYLSGIEVNGYFGPIDILIENNGNGFGADGSSKQGIVGTGNADSKISFDAFFNTEYEIYVDIAGLQLSGIKLHNERGDLSSMHRNATDTAYTSAFGFAHGQRDLYAVKDNVINTDILQMDTTPYVDGMGYDTRYKGDFDIEHISLGDTGESLGSLYLTDVQLTRNWVISAH